MSDLCFLTAIELAADDVEATTIANEGVIGIRVILGVASTTMEALCQIPGRALKVSTRAVLEEIRRTASVNRLLLRYAEAMMVQLAQRPFAQIQGNISRRVRNTAEIRWGGSS